jgi:hypothetical protein
VPVLSQRIIDPHSVGSLVCIESTSNKTDLSQIHTPTTLTIMNQWKQRRVLMRNQAKREVVGKHVQQLLHMKYKLWQPEFYKNTMSVQSYINAVQRALKVKCFHLTLVHMWTSLSRNRGSHHHRFHWQCHHKQLSVYVPNMTTNLPTEKDKVTEHDARVKTKVHIKLWCSRKYQHWRGNKEVDWQDFSENGTSHWAQPMKLIKFSEFHVHAVMRTEW